MTGINKKAPEVNQELNTNYNNTITQYDIIFKNTKNEIYDICENGSLRQLINLRVEVVSEITNNSWLLRKIDNAIKKALRGEV